MKLFREIQPEDAEVLRNGNWVCYDASSVVRGDIIRLREGDTVPADCKVLSLGLAHINVDDGGEGAAGKAHDLLVDVSCVTGESRPKVASVGGDGVADTVQLYYGGRVLQGAAIAIVTAVGDETMLSTLIRDNRWPPKALDGDDKDDEGGVALIPRAV
eukprot:CAMPEP_0172501070 /NCGR_PEP_ID=MMETSP1066-20121228/145888_1 /TAXON_ID=671091 /ORGANISM="Coscinodiscus wailesii, Strain CCMP2513" /LENGTH=157 /DNA_ID=CAMNT_0013275663 /DNA_START=248 /DNA_END=721 /DNA_ORIENTATION=-